MPPMLPAAVPVEPSPWRRLALRGLRVVALGSQIALLFTRAAPRQSGFSLACAAPITFGGWLFIDAGQLPAARRVHRRRTGAEKHWPGWPACAS